MDKKNHFMYGIGYGKLYICGEYAILENSSKAIITSVPKKIIAFISKSTKTTIYDNMHNKEILMEDYHENFTIIQKLINFIRNYVDKYEDFSLTIHNELISDNKKYGLGSSGAVLVAITKAMLRFYNVSYDNLKIFKIIVTFSIINNLKGSMGDVAASCNQGVIFYQKFNQEKLYHYIKNNSPKEIIDKLPWPDLKIEKIDVKAPLEVIAKWTGEAIDTKIHVKRWSQNKKDMFLETNNIRKKIKRMLEKAKYKRFIDRSNQLTLRLKAFLKQSNPNLIIPIIKDIRKNLLYLERISNIPMETIDMKKFIMMYPCGKQSGSGCGDMVLAFKTDTVKKFTVTLDLKKL